MRAKTQEILGGERVTGVRFESGEELPADLVVMAVGVRPNIELAKGAGVACDRGILVDDCLQTYDPAIYAVGECVQHRRQTFGLVAPLWEQARICAQHIAEIGVSRFSGAINATQLKVSGIEVFSAGDFAEAPNRESLVLSDKRRGIYKRVVIEGNRVCGAVLTYTTPVLAQPNFDGADLAGIKQRLSDYLAASQTGLQQSRDQLGQIGPSPVGGGDDTVTRITAGLEQLQKDIGAAKEKVDAADPNNVPAFQAALGETQTSLAQVTAPDALGDLRTSPRLDKAAQQATNCTRLQTVTAPR